ncbi:hypothetical protein Tco_0822643, partial [Tanacetum coccineum]
YELRLVAGIAIGALVKGCSRFEVPAKVKVVAYWFQYLGVSSLKFMYKDIRSIVSKTKAQFFQDGKSEIRVKSRNSWLPQKQRFFTSTLNGSWNWQWSRLVDSGRTASMLLNLQLSLLKLPFLLMAYWE